jgi:hypothetical protein
MNNIEFSSDQQQFKSRNDLGGRRTSGMASWLIKKGIAKDETQASNILLILIILNFILTAFVMYKFIF